MVKFDCGSIAVEASETAKEIYKALLDASINGIEYQGQQENPLVSFVLSNGVAVALRPNKRRPSLYLLNHQKNGLVEHYLHALKLTFYKDSDPHEAIKNGKVKGLENKKDVVMISEISITDFEKVLDFIFPTHSLSFKHGKYEGREKELSPEDLLKKLERQDAIGTKGEDFAIEYEKKRLEKLGADLSKIDEYIIDRRKINVSQGYDIESHFDGQSRYIEGKTTTVNAEADFFFSTNEFNVLKAKGEKAYIYRVVLSEDLESIVEIREIQNPFGNKETSDFKAIAFKANLKDFV